MTALFSTGRLTALDWRRWDGLLGKAAARELDGQEVMPVVVPVRPSADGGQAPSEQPCVCVCVHQLIALASPRVIAFDSPPPRPVIAFASPAPVCVCECLCT